MQHKISQALRLLADALDELEQNKPKEEPKQSTNWVNGKQLATATGLSYNRIRRYATLPNCPAVRIGRSVLYDVAEYKTWIKNNGPSEGQKQLTQQLRTQHNHI